jgi:HD-like signal output (HDOD) protein/ActR/RegA family two-component response regulator
MWLVMTGARPARPAKDPECQVMTRPTRRILFVDDDRQLLSGLGKALRRYRDRWTMVFADSGEAALVEVRRAGFDVVVSDMRMPAMDGATLLAHIRDEDPTTIRMILSGFSDRSAIVRALPVAHQFLNKPCELAELSGAIERACELRALLGGAALRAVVGDGTGGIGGGGGGGGRSATAAAALERLASPPVCYHELAALAGGAELRPDAIAEVVERDAALCERVLRLAASPGLGFERPMRSITEVASRLGIEMLSALALAAHVFALAGDREPGAPPASLDGLEHHALAIARAAYRRAAAGALIADVFLASLLHDVGKLVIALAAPEAHLAIERRLREPGATRHGVERDELGTSHGELGAYLLWHWGLPLPIIDAVAHHDDPAATVTGVLAALRAAHAAPTPGAG